MTLDKGWMKLEAAKQTMYAGPGAARRDGWSCIEIRKRLDALKIKKCEDARMRMHQLEWLLVHSQRDGYKMGATMGRLPTERARFAYAIYFHTRGSGHHHVA